ncbi:MAG: hypothetical protein U0R80_09585 [Nocardioidaceae bacterium]
MNNLRSITAVGIATLALAGGASLSTGAANAGGTSGDDTLAKVTSAKAITQTCDGGKVKKMRYRTSDSQSIPGGTAAQLEGSQWTIAGPGGGTDAVVATVSSFAHSGGAGELTSVELLKDGAPVGGGAKYFTYNGEYDTASVQLCGKVGKGVHTFEIRVTDQSGSATTLYQPSVTYERFE